MLRTDGFVLKLKQKPSSCVQNTKGQICTLSQVTEGALHQSSSSFIVQRESVRSDGLSSKFRCPHRRTRFCRVLEVRVKRSHSPFEDKTTWRLWGISFAQMSSLIQRWMVTFEGQRSRSLWSYVQSLGLPQSFLFFLLLLEYKHQAKKDALRLQVMPFWVPGLRNAIIFTPIY